MPTPDHIESDGPSPNPSDQDPLEELEEEIEDLHRPLGSNEHTTAAEQLRGDSLDERVGREEPDIGDVGSADALTLEEADAPDTEPELVGDEAPPEPRVAPEESAMHVTEEAPGATDHDDDYVEES